MTTLLVVEDDRDIREALRDLLVGEGYRVEEAQDGREACAWLQCHGAPDVVVLDLMMPHMTGEELLDWMRAQRGPVSSVPVVIVSAMRRDVVRRTLVPPVVATLLKPFPAEDLLAEVERHASGKSRQDGPDVG